VNPEPTVGADALVAGFHPAVREWFTSRFPDGPTEPQAAAWPLIATGRDVLVASPTGTGKTLTGFLLAIDSAYRRIRAPAEQRETPRLPEVVYVSPLRALATDIRENLEVPLAGVREQATRLGIEVPDLRVAVRTGDTSPAERAAMRRSPPDLLVTTPESLYLLLTAPGSRSLLGQVRTVIVDEIHAVARDKRGAHLALSLERLSHVVAESGGNVQRIGLSATQRPLDVIGGLLSGSGGTRPPPDVVDCGDRRDLDVAIELPSAELEAVTSGAQFSDVLDTIADHVRHHRTTLVFVNTRKLAERVAHQLSERLVDRPGPAGDDGVAPADEGAAPAVEVAAPAEDGHGVDRSATSSAPDVAAHHGSLSPDRRRQVETRLRAGDLRALVATASLELGIDVGPVELVCQIGSPRAIATFLQRAGRANHHREGTPSARLFPLTRDELVESTALLAAVRRGHLDAIEPPIAPLDVLAQQLVAEVAAAGEWTEDGLYELVRRAAPYADLDRSVFDEVVELVSSGITTGRGRRGAHLHRDGVNGVLRPRPGARLSSLTGGGAIPDTGDYRVVLDPEGVTVGSVHEDFAVEANIGDVFLLGTHSWRVRQVEVGTVRVVDAGDASPTVPFWLGEAPARTAELSREVGDLRATVEEALVAPDSDPSAAIDRAVRVVRERSGVSAAAAEQVVGYLAAGHAALGALPTARRLVVERFFDESEGTQLVVHSPYGGRVNRALGLALRKRFCVSFDFELQAAADDDTVVLSLGPQHSFPLPDVWKMLPSHSAADVLTQAVLAHPMLRARWRWNCTRALVVARSVGGRRRPIHLQRMDADDVMAAAWPSLAACQENAPPGPIPIPDHVLVRQTVTDCLHEALDVDGLVALLEDVASGRVEVVSIESAEPSVLSHGILSGRPYTFLDGAPLEERRSRAVPLGRGTGTGLPVPPGELAPLDRDAVTTVLDQVRPRPRTPDQLHDLLLSLVRARPVPEWHDLFDMLVGSGRAGDVDGEWVATERREKAETLDDDDGAAADCVRGHLEVAGPVTVDALAGDGPLPSGAPRGVPLTTARTRTALARLEAEGSAIELPDGTWCARHLLVRMHAATRGARRRRHSDPVSIRDFVGFLARWQHVAPGTRQEGRAGLFAVLGQLAGVELPAGDWERSILPARVVGYEPRWLDELCLSGEVAWGRLTPRPVPAEGGVAATRRGSATPSPATPLALVPRADLPWLLAAVRQGESATAPVSGASADVLEVLTSRGACFRAELGPLSRRLPAEVDQGLWDLVARGIVTADAFSAVRSLLGRRRRGVPGGGRARRVPGPFGVREPPGSGLGEGRWACLPDAAGPDDDPTGGDRLAEEVAGRLLVRWGVVMWELWSRESFRVPWRDVVRALRRMEARGVALGGRFVAGLAGEQYALPEAVDMLTGPGNAGGDVAPVVVAASDPLNLTGSVVPGPRIPAVRHRRVTITDGTVAADAGTG
jgi:ATP-dependent Lhr-like helicase